MDRWVGKVAVVTGASAGIGADIVKALSEKGVIVVGLARREEKLKEIAAACKGTIHTRKCDITDEDDVVKTFDWIESTLGGVDILINNAGVIKPEHLNNGKTEGWKAILDTNVLALSITTREALKTMRKRGDNGHIIHINSYLGHFVAPYVSKAMGMYSASKFAVTALSQALRLELQELKSKIKVTSVSPGAVYTDIIRNFMSNLTGVSLGPDGPAPQGYLEVEDVTDGVMYCLSTRPLAQVHELTIRSVEVRQGF